MEIVIAEFETKVEEINEYFLFIEKTTHLRFNINEDTIQVSETVHQVLKSNLFLLLYNLIESSFKNALEKICIDITTDRLIYKDVIPQIKQLWVNREYKNFGDKCSIPRDTSKSEFLVNKIDSISTEVVSIAFKNNLSGNVTPKVIKEAIGNYGLNTEKVLDDTEHPIYIIKERRNNLAHGNESFSECGRSYTLERLQEIKDESIDYMQFILEHIRDFTENKKYKLEE